ncbi:MAG: hypothetical protein ABJH72_16465 [Reichenbachiella sp.]|uniref:hypothetical protein n=1 Tax=Reichenbachiella sp. TaxID=2184521 RepID=UPI0032990D09
MRKIISFSLIMLVWTSLCMAQAPAAFKYQAIARDDSGNPLVNQTINFQIQLLQGATNGASVYTETHLVTTNGYGLVNMTIGEGSVSGGTFNTIDWASGPYFIHVEVDTNGGSSFQVLGTTQMLSVPYALYAESSGSSVPGPKGETGATGATGPAGPKGDTGDTGPKGDKGETGAEGPQGSAGSNGAQGIQGDKGDTGDQGLQGIQGLPGNDGADGAQGIQGIQGVKGDKGDKGDTGDQGLQGIQGIPGNDGADGPQGLQGAAGPKGDKGDTGDQGLQGIQGLPGNDGADGAQGIQGIQGVKGDKGDKGDTGDQGPQGIQGIPGNNGADGAQGIQGVKGDTGDQGLQGIQGTPGNDGADGAVGPRGLQGIQGIQGPRGPAGQDANAGTQFFYLTAQDFEVYDNSVEINYTVQYDNIGGLQSGRAYLVGGKDQAGRLIAQINLPDKVNVKQIDAVTDDDRGQGVKVHFMELPFDVSGGGAQSLGTEAAKIGTKQSLTISVNRQVNTADNLYYILFEGFTHDSLPINNSIYRVRIVYEN